MRESPTPHRPGILRDDDLVSGYRDCYETGDNI